MVGGRGGAMGSGHMIGAVVSSGHLCGLNLVCVFMCGRRCDGTSKSNAVVITVFQTSQTQLLKL